MNWHIIFPNTVSGFTHQQFLSKLGEKSLAFEQRDTFRVRVCKASENSFLVYSYNGGARFCDIVAFAFLPNAYYNGSVVCPSVGIR